MLQIYLGIAIAVLLVVYFVLRKVWGNKGGSEQISNIPDMTPPAPTVNPESMPMASQSTPPAVSEDVNLPVAPQPPEETPK